MYLVAYDGSEYAKGSLLRAVEWADLTRVEVEVLTVIPNSARFAKEYGWVSDADEYEFRQLVEELHEQVTSLASEAAFEYHAIDGYTKPARIAQEIRRYAIEQNATVVFVGGKNAGSIITSVGSVGGTVAAENEYDVHIVRTSPQSMTDIDPDRREAWLQENKRPKPSWGGDTLQHTH